MRQKFGRLKGNIVSPGPAFINPFTTVLVKIPTRTVNREVKLNLPSKEGLNVSAEISILYHVKQEKTIDIINEVGANFERVLILSILGLLLLMFVHNFMQKICTQVKEG